MAKSTRILLGAGIPSFILSAFILSGAAWAGGDGTPDCLSWDGQSMAVNNAEVLHWERTTANQFRDRAHVTGTIAQVYPSQNGHLHFELSLGKNDQDMVEIIYNEDFGQTPQPAVGMQVEACGDYITSTDQSGPYPPSPDGAIIHWVHMNPKAKGHPPGYLVMNGVLCGQDAENAGPKHHGPKNGNDGELTADLDR